MNETPIVTIRAARPGDLGTIARIWTQGWHDAHRAHVGAALVAERGEGSFRARAEARLPSTLVAEARAAVAGFVVVVEDEVEQVYVDRPWRGTQVAAQLLAAAERRVAAAGFPLAWLAVIPQNARARRFYEKHGWRDEGEFDYGAEGAGAEVAVPCRRYVKAATPTPPDQATAG